MQAMKPNYNTYVSKKKHSKKTQYYLKYYNSISSNWI